MGYAGLDMGIMDSSKLPMRTALDFAEGLKDLPSMQDMFMKDVERYIYTHFDVTEPVEVELSQRPLSTGFAVFIKGCAIMPNRMRISFESFLKFPVMQPYYDMLRLENKAPAETKLAKAGEAIAKWIDFNNW